MHDGCRDLVAVFPLRFGEEEDFEGFMGGVHFFIVVDTGHGNFSLGDVMVVVDVVAEQAHVFNPELFSRRSHHLIKDVVASLQRHLGDDTSLLQQI